MASKSIERWNRDGLFLKEEFEKAGYNVQLRFSNGDSYQQNAVMFDVLSKKDNKK